MGAAEIPQRVHFSREKSPVVAGVCGVAQQLNCCSAAFSLLLRPACCLCTRTSACLQQWHGCVAAWDVVPEPCVSAQRRKSLNVSAQRRKSLNPGWVLGCCDLRAPFVRCSSFAVCCCCCCCCTCCRCAFQNVAAVFSLESVDDHPSLSLPLPRRPIDATATRRVTGAGEAVGHRQVPEGRAGCGGDRGGQGGAGEAQQEGTPNRNPACMCLWRLKLRRCFCFYDLGELTVLVTAD